MDGSRRRRPPADGLDEAFGPAGPAIRSFLRTIARLTPDDLDRLSVSAPEFTSAAIRPFVPPDLWQRVEALDRLLVERLPAALRADPVAMAAATAYGHALVLEPFALHHFANPDVLAEGMRRGWEAAVGQPRYGPNGREVRALIERFRRATPDEGAALARGWAALGITEDPWPCGRLAVRLRRARGLGGPRPAGRGRGAGPRRPVRGGAPRTGGGVRADGPCDHAAPGVLRAGACAPADGLGLDRVRPEGTPAGADGAAGSGQGGRAALGRELGRQREPGRRAGSGGPAGSAGSGRPQARSAARARPPASAPATGRSARFTDTGGALCRSRPPYRPGW